MKPSSAKSKGRKVAEKLREKLLEYAQDELGEKDIRITPSGVTGEDVLLSEKAFEIYPFAIECKNREKLNIWQALKQSRYHKEPNRFCVSILCFSRNRDNTYVALELDDFLKLIR